MRVALLTYRRPHLKTQQLLGMLSHEPGIELELFGLPFRPRPRRSPAFEHRPSMFTAGEPVELARHFGLRYTPVESANDIGPFDAAVVGGAGLLPPEFIARVPVVNGHPGLIPAVRGLDSFKWAIYERRPLGVSLHLVDAEVDSGQHLKSVRTPVFPNDTLETLARRHYDAEIALLGRFRRYLDSPVAPLPGLAEGSPRMRMPGRIERQMIDSFSDYVREFRVAR